MCNFECIYELGGLCLLDKEPCISDCDRFGKCIFCDRDCQEDKTASERSKYESK